MKKEEKVIYQIKKGYSLQEIAGEYLAVPISLMEEAQEKVAVLNSCGKVLWELLQKGRSVEDLVQSMTDMYDVSKEEAHNDVMDFIKQLEFNQLLLVKE